MSTQAATRRASGRSRGRARPPHVRRRLGALIVAGLAGLLLVSGLPSLRQATNELSLPLRHEDIIRQQASRRSLDPALVAAVIYAESKFADNTTSRAGAEGLMQLTPATAQGIATRTGGIAFRTADLATPQVNIAYGTWYLRNLLDRYAGDKVAALAAYNAGMGNVDRWMADARARGHELGTGDIPYGETRAYVGKVLTVRGAYARQYRHELGL
jgi:soluble lytic murein transglycosylase